MNPDQEAGESGEERSVRDPKEIDLYEGATGPMLAFARGLFIAIGLFLIALSVFGEIMLIGSGNPASLIIVSAFVAVQIGGLIAVIRFVRRTDRIATILGTGILAALLWVTSIGLCSMTMQDVGH